MSIYFVYALSTLNGISVSAAQIVLALYALKLGASPFAVGVLAATFSIFPMLLAVTAGRLVDRFGARWPMMFGAVISGIGMLVPYLFPGLPAVYVAGAMTGVTGVFFNLATQNLVGMLGTVETRARNFSNYTLTISVATLLGPLIGGFSIDHSDHATACLYVALAMLVPIVMLAVRGAALPGGTGRVEKASGGIREMLSDPAVRRMLATGALVNAGVSLYQFYMPVYAHSIGLSASAIGMVLAMSSAAAFIVRFGLPQLLAKFGEERLLAYAFYIGAASLALIPFFHNPLLLALVSFTLGIGTGCGQPIVTMLMYTNSKEGRSGEALGLKFTTNQLTKLVKPIVFGAIASAFGLFPTFWINAAMMAAGGLINRTRTKGS